MRRKERKITEQADLEAMIKGCYYLALVMPDTPQPYVVPLNFGYTTNTIYMHCATAGYKLDLLRKAGGKLPVSLLFVSKGELLDRGQPEACNLSSRYASVVACAELTEVADDAERRNALVAMLEQTGMQHKSFENAEMKGLVVLRADIKEMVGKRNDPAK